MIELRVGLVNLVDYLRLLNHRLLSLISQITTDIGVGIVAVVVKRSRILNLKTLNMTWLLREKSRLVDWWYSSCC